MRNKVVKSSRASTAPQIVASMRRSILPPPDEMRQYESMNPGTLKVLVDAYKSQSEHRIALENDVIKSDITTAHRGQVFAFVITMTVVIGGFVLIAFNKDVLGIVSILGAVAALVGLFINRQISRNNSLANKAQVNPDSGNI